MTKILDELDRLNSEDIVAVKNNKVIKEGILLLNAPAEDTSLLTAFGIDHQIKQAQAATNLSNRQVAMATKFEADTYTGKQLKQLCIDYYLKVLPVNYFRGNIPVELTEKIREFASKNDIILTGNSENFFILAPYTQFTHDRFNDKYVVERALKVKSTPILFYREGRAGDLANTEQVFTKIHSWGENSFSWGRSFNFLFNFDDYKDSVAPGVRSLLICSYILVGLIFGFIGFVYFPVVMFGIAGLTMWSNNMFTITPDKLWNRANANHK